MMNELHDSLAERWPLISVLADHEEEAAAHGTQPAQIGNIPADTVLELGGGGGNNASWLKRQFRMTSVARLPGCSRTAASSIRNARTTKAT
jgi:hypothetical protein